MTKEEFIYELKKINIDLTEEKINKLNKFYQLLIKWNDLINLTTITKLEDVYLKHFYDSLTLIKVVNLNESITILDVGSGAGFPGIVLKIVFPNLTITLLDSLNKRVIYLENIIQELDLKGINVVCDRAEEYTKKHIEEYDLVVSRAVAHLKILSEITFQSVKVGGFLVAMKGNIEEELASSKEIISNLNGEIAEINNFQLPIELSTRNLVKIKKIKSTPTKYPRKYSEIKKMKKN